MVVGRVACYPVVVGRDGDGDDIVAFDAIGEVAIARDVVDGGAVGHRVERGVEKDVAIVAWDASLAGWNEGAVGFDSSDGWDYGAEIGIVEGFVDVWMVGHLAVDVEGSAAVQGLEVGEGVDGIVDAGGEMGDANAGHVDWGVEKDAVAVTVVAAVGYEKGWIRDGKAIVKDD